MSTGRPILYISAMLIGRGQHLIRYAVALSILSAAIYMLALIYIFPGYFDPLWPQTIDFYSALMIANSQHTPWGHLFSARPAGFLALDAFGRLGLHAQLVPYLAMTLINTSITAILLYRALNISLGIASVVAFSAYALLIYSHPAFYVAYLHDVWATQSYLFFALAMCCLVGSRLHPWIALVPFGILVALAALTKETYYVTFCVIISLWAVLQPPAKRYYAIASALTAFGILLATAAISRYVIASPFYGVGAAPASDYVGTANLAVIGKEWLTYAQESFTPATAAIVAATLLLGLLLIPGYRGKLLLIGTCTAGLVAWLPNSTLPNHHTVEYSWNGSYLIFAPVLLAAQWQIRNHAIMAVAMGSIALFAVLSPFVVANPYAKAAHWQAQETVQRKILRGIASAQAETGPHACDDRILVSGLTPSFTPFDQGAAIEAITGKCLSFDVISYRPRPQPVFWSRLYPRIHFVRPSELTLASYSVAWIFKQDGSLLSVSRGEHPLLSALDEPPGVHLGQMALLFPGAFDIHLDPRAPEGYWWLIWGVRLLEYGEGQRAQPYLIKASELIHDNPYPWYFLGTIAEAENRTREAHDLYLKASETETGARNPGFAGAIERTSHAD